MAIAAIASPAPTRAAEPLSLPENLLNRVSALDEDQREFIESGTVLDYIPVSQLKHELATRDEAGLQLLLSDLMSLAEQMTYDPERDMGAAPLNLESKWFNSHEQSTPDVLRDHEREPGPFSVHRYLYPKSGVPTFGGAKVAIWPEDLTAGNVDVAFIGLPSNMGSGRRDASHAPSLLRSVNTLSAPDDQTLLRPFEVLNIVDYGNFRVDNLATERTVQNLVNRIAETAETGAMPMLVGGDTSMLYPGVKGVAQARGGDRFGLLHFGAHPDAEREHDHTISDTQALFMLLSEGVVDGKDTVPVGLRGPALDANTLNWLRGKKVRYHTMTEIRERGFEKVARQIRREVEKGPDALFVSVDVSVLDPTQMIAGGRIAAQGMQLAQVTGLIRQVCATKEIVGFILTDMAPMLDLSRLSAIHSSAIMNACLAGMAVRASGLDADYVHPLVLDHGQ